MPLLPGTSDDIISQNIKTLRAEGRPEAQAIAISLRKANKHKAMERAKKGVMTKSRPKVKVL